MKLVSKDGLTWLEHTKGKVEVGFTKKCLEMLDECWHIIPASQTVAIKEGQPLLSIETNDRLFSIKSPVTGLVTFFNNEAMNMPDHLKEETVVMYIEDEAAVKQRKAADAAAFNARIEEINAEILRQRPQPQLRQPRFQFGPDHPGGAWPVEGNVIPQPRLDLGDEENR